MKARYRGLCCGCGADTQSRNGKGYAYAYCKACHPGAIERRWTRDRVLDAMRAWRAQYGRLPSSYDWSRTHARRRGGETLGDWSKLTGCRRARHERPWKLGRGPRLGLRVANTGECPAHSSATTAS